MPNDSLETSPKTHRDGTIKSLELSLYELFIYADTLDTLYKDDRSETMKKQLEDIIHGAHKCLDLLLCLEEWKNN